MNFVVWIHPVLCTVGFKLKVKKCKNAAEALERARRWAKENLFSEPHFGEVEHADQYENQQA